MARLSLACTCRSAALSDTEVVQPERQKAGQLVELRHHMLQDFVDGSRLETEELFSM